MHVLHLECLSCSKVRERTEHETIWNKPLAPVLKDGIPTEPSPSFAPGGRKGSFQATEGHSLPPSCLYPAPGAQCDTEEQKLLQHYQGLPCLSLSQGYFSLYEMLKAMHKDSTMKTKMG